MFEQEMELEEHEGRGFGPIIIIIIMIVILVGGVAYMVIENNRMLKPTEASLVIENGLKTRPASQVKFHTGRIVASANDTADRPQYKLLADAGLLTIKTDKKSGAADVALTADGEAMLKSIPGVVKKDESDGTVAYAVPLASRKFMKVDNIVKNSAKRFTVTYSWQWVPNKLGDIFDADGTYVKKFPTYDRTVLIDKYGADFFHAQPISETADIVQGADNWEFARD